ncbi:MAG TPA: 2,3,4,5-tetrahydropyridine-2,6-dicarboxylate N-succinyltransferase [Gemmatimonadaceae bacterium]|jgi:2,3,4,5-tetrahydropyridine-2-carboxylate N-succinyltransferase|nr:2,3,4,5-tetrahydropyridine-2,6-dicarboxylate N-succinyltransferase [Gemmatimonadaceae bacterium]
MANRLAERIEQYAATPAGEIVSGEALTTVNELLDGLESGELRAAERSADGRWNAVAWVKRGILLGFRIGTLEQSNGGVLSFVDKNTYPVRTFDVEDNVRVVPGGSSVRRGTYVAPTVVCMPPMYINVGAYVDAGTMVDSHALIGSCAQIGKRVHVSAAAQIGGVLEPVNAAPVIVEDDVLVGGNCGVYEGTIVRARAVLAAGVVLTRGTPVFDLVRERVYKASADAPLEIPPAAVVVPGARAIRTGWGAEQQLSLQAPVIVKYRDEKTDLATALEGWLR